MKEMSLKGHFKITNHVLLLSRRKLWFPGMADFLKFSPGLRKLSTTCTNSQLVLILLLSPNGHTTICIFIGENVHVFEYIIVLFPAIEKSRTTFYSFITPHDSIFQVVIFF